MSTSQSLDGALALARTYLDARNHRAVLRSLGPVFAAGDAPVEAYCLAAAAELGLDDPKAAIRYCRTATALDPTADWPLRIEARAQSRLGAHEEAFAAATAAVDLAPDNWPNLTIFVDVSIAARRIDARTEQIAAAAVRLAPEEPATFIAAGNLALRLDRLATAEQAYREALRRDPQHPAARNNLALLHLRVDKTGSAASASIDVLSDTPQSRHALVNLRAAIDRRLFSSRMTLMALLFCSDVSIAAAAPYSPFPETAVRAVFAFTAAAGVVVALLFVDWLRKSLGSRLVALARASRRLDPLLRAGILLLAATVVLMIAAPFFAIVIGLWVYLAVTLTYIASVFVAVRRFKYHRVWQDELR